jgi:EAL domain-containing protein (putative c-di-GMP-specific phosphodiesterase class I)/GGDEF domain-containing protein
MTADTSRTGTERPEAELLRLRSVLHDRVTGLPTCAVLHDRLRGHLERRRHLGVIHLEIADLDLVESLYGWQVFDRIVERLARGLRSAVGGVLPRETLLAINAVAGDCLVAFVVETAEGREVDAVALGRMSADLRAALERVLDTEDFAGLSPRLRLRTGHGLLSEDPFYRFERRVDAAIEEARTFSERRERRRARTRDAELKHILSSAAVTTVFQPVVDLATREVVGFEALSRGPKDSFFEMPRTLFALSARAGMALDLDRLCREAALREWRRAAGRGKVFLNVLPGSLRDPAWLGESGAGAAVDASIPPEGVVIELSERDADDDLARFASALGKIRGRGFGLALDDLGTGYATFAAVEALRPDFLKLDVSMVRDIHRHLIKQDLLSSVVQIARRLGAAVIAEGVESEEEAAVLLEGGARYAQGYLFAEPGPAPPGGCAGKPGVGP